jgi:hypothetical protein
LEKVERRELPGNDASWYEALLGERGLGQQATSEVPVDQSTPDNGPTASPDGAVLLDPTSEDHPQLELAGDGTADIPGTPDSEDVSIAEPSPTEDPVAEDVAAEDDAVADATTESAEEATSPLVRAVPPIEVDDSPVETTSEMVGQLWTTPQSEEAMDTWEPGDMDRKIKSSRSFRWTSLTAVLAIAALIVVGLVMLPSIARGRADSHLDMYTTVLRELRGELPDTQQSLAVATDPPSTSAELAALSTQLTVLAADASALDEAAQAELPATPPLTSSAPIDELEPIRQRLEPLGTVAHAIQRRISNVVDYRILMSGFLALPDLPVAANATNQAELRVTLAAAQAESASILAELPSDVALDAHRALARDINERFSTWQVDYLEALRTEDAATAGDLLTELDGLLTELDNELVTPLAQIRRQTDTDLIDLARSIDQILLLTNGETQAVERLT